MGAGMQEREYAILYRGLDPRLGWGGWQILKRYGLSLDLAEAELAELRESDPENTWAIGKRLLAPWKPIEDGRECLPICNSWWKEPCSCGRNV